MFNLFLLEYLIDSISLLTKTYLIPIGISLCFPLGNYLIENVSLLTNI